MELKEIKETFESFEMSDTKVEEVLQKSKALQQNLDPVVKEYKFKLQGNKSHRFEGKEVMIKEIFGSLATFDNDKVNYSVKVIQL